MIGHTTATSGPLAAFGNIGVGMREYFDYVNANGGIGPDGLQIELLIRDDAYVATRTQGVLDIDGQTPNCDWLPVRGC